MSEALRRRLAERIRADGPLTFAEFMEAALYDPEEGFYAGLPVSRDGHFVTSPHVSPAFGALVGRQVAEAWDLLGKPDPFTVVEVGAGDGTLARQVLEAADSVPELRKALRYVAVERSPAARKALADAGIEVLEDMAEIEDGVAGCVLANEVLDNLPLHRLRERDGRTVEVRVGLDGERLVEVEADSSPEAMAALREPLRPGEERPVSPATLELVRQTARTLERGYTFFFDYGFGPGEDPAEVQAYRDMRVTGDLLADPGSRDVTAAVDLGAVAEEARRNRLTVWGPVPQGDALLALGFRSWLAGVRARERELADRGDDRAAIRMFAARSEASILIDPDKLGGLRLLALGTEGLPAPASVLGDREAGC